MKIMKPVSHPRLIHSSAHVHSQTSLWIHPLALAPLARLRPKYIGQSRVILQLRMLTLHGKKRLYICTLCLGVTDPIDPLCCRDLARGTCDMMVGIGKDKAYS